MNKTLFLLLSLALTPVLGLGAGPVPSLPGRDPGYAFGLLMGQSLTNAGMDLSVDQIILGLKDSLGQGVEPQLTADEAKQIVNAAFLAHREKVAAEQLAREQAWLAVHGKKEGVTTTPSGLQYEILSRGDGARPGATDVVKVDYEGTLVDGKVFDSSIQRGEPAVFPVDQVIPGWTEGVQLMGVGDRFRFTIPSNLGYGSEGAGNGIIPPYSTLVFEVTLLSIEPPQATEPSEEVPAPGQ